MIDGEKAIEYCGCNQPICRKGFETKDKQNCTCARKKNYLDGLAEGRKEKQKIVDTQTVAIESRDVWLAEKESIIIRQQTEPQNLKKEIAELKEQNESLAKRILEQQTTIGNLTDLNDKLQCCENCKKHRNCECPEDKKFYARVQGQCDEWE